MNMEARAICELVVYGTICADTYIALCNEGIDPEALTEWFYTQQEES